MKSSEQLDQFINDLQDGKALTPQTREEALTADLIDLAQGFDLSAEFDNHVIEQLTQRESQTHKFPTPWLRLTASLVIVILGITVLFATVPALRVLAEEIVRELFTRDIETKIIIEDGLAFDADAYLRSENFEDLQSQIDFEVNKPDLSAMGYSFDLITYTIPRRASQLNYLQPLSNNSDFWKLRIRQQPLVDSVNGMFYFKSEQDTISPEAEITIVSIGGYKGELVQGDWFTNYQTSYYYWSGDSFVYRIRWQDETFLYEIELWETADNAIEQIISIANSMME